MHSNPSPVKQVLNSWRTGLALMLVGGTTLGVGLVQTTAAHLQPSCPAGMH